MDRVVAARKLIAELVKAEQIEVRRVEIVGRDLAQLVETLGQPPSGRELEAWLDEHAQVTELYAGPTLLDELIARYLAPPPPTIPEDAVEARHPDLERQLRDSESSEPFLVYADWLQEHADPLGELIALGVAATTGTEDDVARFERHLRLHEGRFLGGLAAQLNSRIALRWRHGMVHAIQEIDAVTPNVWAQLLQLRVCELVESITLRWVYTAEHDAAIAENAKALRTLAFEGCQGKLPPQLLARDLRSLALAGWRVTLPEAFPANLERLELRAEVTPVVPLHATIRELHVLLTPAIAQVFVDARLPRLERLTVHLDGASAANLVELLAELELPVLTHLAIADGLLDPRTFEALAKLPIAASLTSLALANLELTDAAIQALAGSRTAFAALTELDVSFNELSRVGLATARTFTANVVSKRQHKRGNGMEQRVRKFAGSRLQAAEGIADPKAWRRAGVDGEIRWARYRGDDDYELFVSADLQRYGCSCPSSIQPCKHVVALALVAERTTLPAVTSNRIEERLNRPLALALVDSIEEPS